MLIEALLHLVEHARSERDYTLTAADTADEIDRLRVLVFAHAERLARLKAEPPHCYADLLNDDHWIADRQSEMEGAIAAESGRLAQLVIRQAELLAQRGIDRRISGGDPS